MRIERSQIAVDDALRRAMDEVRGPFFFVGSGKNAGKTTVLNRVNRVFAEDRPSVGVTTIGHDGEALDAVLGTAKPPVEVHPGNLVCLTRRMLDDAAGVLELVEPTGLETPVGSLVLGRCVRAGNVEILGPETNARTERVCRRMEELGVDVVLVDGAFSRRTQIALRDRAPLAYVVSGDVGATLDEVAENVRHAVELFGLAQIEGIEIEEIEPMGIHECDAALVLRGPLLDKTSDELARRARGRTVVIDDATKVFCDEAAWRRLRRAADVRVRRAFDLRFIGANPTARFKNAFEPGAFATAVADAVRGLMVVDVVSGLAAE